MFFWMVLLTFFSSLLIYAFYPRNDAITIEDKPQANIAVADLLTQHLAAVEAAEIWDASRQKAYVKWVKDANIGGIYEVPYEKYDAFVPAGYNFSETLEATGEPVTKVYCIQNNGSDPTQYCGTTSGEYSTSDFLVTYITDVPLEFDSYIAGLSRRSLGEKMFLTEYINDRHDSLTNNRSFGGYSLKSNCGIVRCGNSKNDWPASVVDFDPEGVCVLDNTRHYTVRVPANVSLLDGSLACITRLSVTYEPDVNNNLRIVYPTEN